VYVNANTGTWWTEDPVGVETFIFTTGGEAERFAKLVKDGIVAAYGLPDRGVKTYNFHVVREVYKVGIPSILTETGFIDSKYDAMLLISDEYREKIAIAHVKGICLWTGIEFIPEN